jgi:DNA-binding NarL/FixJ family response regulator
MRVLIADDHALLRAGIRLLLSEVAGAKVVAETGDGHDALALIAEKRPDVALVEVSLPGLNGLDVAARARKEHPSTRILILAADANEEHIRRALVVGAAGYLLKNADRNELELALRAVSRGDVWLSPEVSTKVAAAYARNSRSASDEPFEVLTPRQREVLQLIAEGLSSKEIAARIGVSVKTVDTHRTELMERLGIRGIAGLVRYAIRVGMVRPGL